MTVKKGWHGRFFENFAVGDVYEHALGRTIILADNTRPWPPSKGWLT
jgi:acyl dehydratase